MWWLYGLVLVAGVSDIERKGKLLCCIDLTRLRLSEDNEKTMALMDGSEFTKERVMTTVMIQMISHCVQEIAANVVDELLKVEDNGHLLIDYLHLVPLPTGKYVKEQDLMLSNQEAEVLTEVEEMIREGEEMKNKPETKEKPAPGMTPAVGYVFLFLVFALFAGCVIYGICLLRKAPIQKKRKTR